MMEPTRFWMVHGDGTGPTNHRHEFRDQAEHEAKRLARQCPDTVFYVLEAVDAYVKVDVQQMAIRDSAVSDDEIPF